MTALRGLPAVHRLLGEASIVPYHALLGRESVKRAIDVELDRARHSEPLPDHAALVAEIVERLDRARMETLLPAINGTGVVLHTNLGRAPIANEALAAAALSGRGYSNLEFDLVDGARGSRYARVSDLLRTLTGAQDALVVNNCAAAVLLMLDSFAKGREVVVARNQLIEIGGGFRLPDVLQRSGARLIEVGAVNKVYLRDYERALSPQTALVMRSHASNFAMTGFTHDVEPAQLAAFGERAGIPVVEDLGSGALVDLAEYGLAHERTVQEAIADGMDAVAFSGDKLLGGPQAGIIVGKTTLVARLRSNPLLRALRVDKLTIAALHATLSLYLTSESRTRIPFYRMIATTHDALRDRAQRYIEALPDGAVHVAPSIAYVGGGSLPQTSIASLAVVVRATSPERVAARLRRSDPPIVGRVEAGRLLLDLRTIAPEEDSAVISALRSL